jgi:flagellar M-ring protein FliF
MGYNKDRGDSISVANSLFIPDEKETVDTPLWKQPEMLTIAKELGKYLLMALHLPTCSLIPAPYPL